ARGGAGITFVRNVDEISGLVLESDGDYVAAQRLSAHAPRLARNAIAVDPRTLADYVGDYDGGGGALLRVSVDGDGLAAQYTGTAPLRMRAYARDRFADADGTNQLLFRRDERGAVSNLTVELAGGEREAAPVHWRRP